MSATSTFATTIYADSHTEMIDEAERVIADFANIPEEDVYSKVSYEMIIKPTEEGESEYDYRADLVARIKITNDR